MAAQVGLEAHEVARVGVGHPELPVGGLTATSKSMVPTRLTVRITDGVGGVGVDDEQVVVGQREVDRGRVQLPPISSSQRLLPG